MRINLNHQATPIREAIERSRRSFLATSASGIGHVALASLLLRDGVLAAGGDSASGDGGPRIDPRPAPFAPKAKSCIFLFMEGAPSQLDLFDPKPKLNELHGQPLPESMTKNVRFAFIQKESAVLMGSPRKFQPHGRCGMELSDLLPHLGSVADDLCLVRSMHTDSFNHHPGQLAMQAGVPLFGRPAMGAWLNYGLGSVSSNLPGYVVLTAGRGTSGGASLWSSGFLPSNHAGVLFRNQGEPVLNLNLPSGVTPGERRAELDALARLNRRRLDDTGDPEIASRISAYELAYRMQSSAPELIDLSGETKETLDLYGVNRDEQGMAGGRSGGAGTFASFAKNCLLARRMVERGVRFVNLFHASWDHHSGLDRELPFASRMADQPVAALITDLKRRGLLDETLVVFGAEFGRTPLGENRGSDTKNHNTGRDHHPFAFSLLLAGGGIGGGRVVGKTDEIGWNIVEDPIHIHDLHATLLHLFGIDHTRLVYRFQGRDFRLTDVAGKVVDKLLA